MGCRISQKLMYLFSRVFLETIFGSSTSRPSSIDSRSGASDATESSTPRKLRELYKRAKLLFDLSESQA